jgi:hypothetical protein
LKKSNYKFSKDKIPRVKESNNAESNHFKLPKSNPAEKLFEANIMYKCANKKYLLRYLHAACFILVPSMWIKAIKNGNFATWPGLTEELVQKHLPNEIDTVTCHLNQRRKNLCSTRRPAPVEPIPDADDFKANPPCLFGSKTHQIFAALVDVG